MVKKQGELFVLLMLDNFKKVAYNADVGSRVMPEYRGDRWLMSRPPLFWALCFGF
jgi:hypothetical protein